MIEKQAEDKLKSLRKLRNKKELADLLDFFSIFKDYPEKLDDLYRTYYIESDRYVEQPKDQLLIIQRRLHFILREAPRPAYVYTLKSHVQNASVHRNSKELLNLDIRKFFPSTSSGKVYKFFKQHLECSHVVSSFAAELFTLKGHLPTGSPSSPILAYWINAKLWNDINNLCRRFGCIFTLYMDDLTISGKKIDPQLERLIIKRLKHHKYVINPDKRKFYGVKEEKEVTGVKILLDGTLVPNDIIYEKKSLLMMLLGSIEDEESVGKVKTTLNRLNAYQNYIEKIGHKQVIPLSNS